jgi:hypothetical protein
MNSVNIGVFLGQIFVDFSRHSFQIWEILINGPHRNTSDLGKPFNTEALF